VPVERLPVAVREVSGCCASVRDGVPAARRGGRRVRGGARQPWGGFNTYLGGFRSTVAINADLPVGLGALPALSRTRPTPATTPSGAASRSRRRLPELDLWLVNTPRTCSPRGWPTSGCAASGLRDWGAVATELYADLGIAYDGERGQRIAGGGAARRGAAGRRDPAARPRRLGDEARTHLAAGRCCRRRGRARRSVPHRPAVAGVHLDLRRGRAAAVALAATRVRRACRWAGASSACWTSS
jgi:hypothetical protein